MENSIVDMGEEYLYGRSSTPDDRLQPTGTRISEGSPGPAGCVILLDFILGYNASMDPVGELVDAIKEAQNC